MGCGLWVVGCGVEGFTDIPDSGLHVAKVPLPAAAAWEASAP